MRELSVIQRSRFTTFEILSLMDGMTKGVTKSYTPWWNAKASNHSKVAFADF
jgi:hypothetical protein